MSYSSKIQSVPSVEAAASKVASCQARLAASRWELQSRDRLAASLALEELEEALFEAVESETFILFLDRSKDEYTIVAKDASGIVRYVYEEEEFEEETHLPKTLALVARSSKAAKPSFLRVEGGEIFDCPEALASYRRLDLY